MDECAVKSGEWQSLHKSLVQTQQEFAECKEALTRKDQEIGVMMTELAHLADDEGNVLPSVKDKITKELCESSTSGSQFYSLTMSMVSCALTELVDAICDGNPSVTMPYVVDMYCNKEAKYQKLSQEVSKDVEIEGSKSNLGDQSARRVNP